MSATAPFLLNQSHFETPLPACGYTIRSTVVTTAILVQARTGSTRLPGKVLKHIGSRTVLEEVVSRCLRVRGANVVVASIPDLERDDVLVPVAERAGAIVSRGSEVDVLARFIKSARSVDADIVVRITSDCPLIDPEIVGRLLELRASERADYAANDLERSYPVGLDCEAFTMKALLEADKNAAEESEREHVTPWLRKAPHLKRTNLHSGDSSLAKLRWVLDYPEDLEFVRAVFAALPASSPGLMADVLDVLRRDPSIAKLNAMHAVPGR
jgi:spore coat polysaccharide biosynthesis protein SpsF (cytidylyltransferase family)